MLTMGDMCSLWGTCAHHGGHVLIMGDMCSSWGHVCDHHVHTVGDTCSSWGHVLTMGDMCSSCAHLVLIMYSSWRTCAHYGRHVLIMGACAHHGGHVLTMGDMYKTECNIIVAKQLGNAQLQMYESKCGCSLPLLHSPIYYFVKQGCYHIFIIWFIQSSNSGQ